MKFSFCLETLYPQLPFHEKMSAAKKDGIEAIEFWNWRNKDISIVAESARSLPLPVSLFSGNRVHSMIDPAEREAFLAEVAEAGSIAVQLGCKNLMMLTQSLLPDGKAVPLPANLSERQKMEQAIRRGIELGKLAEKLDVTMVIEPLNTILDHPDYFLDCSQKAFTMIREINHPRVKLLYDIYHMTMMGENVQRDIETGLDWIAHFHAADIPNRHEPGAGRIDYASILTQLQTLHFDGYFGFEFFPSMENSHAVVKNVLQRYSRFC